MKTIILATMFGTTVPITASLAFEGNAWAVVVFAVGICFAGQLNKPYMEVLTK